MQGTEWWETQKEQKNQPHPYLSQHMAANYKS